MSKSVNLENPGGGDNLHIPEAYRVTSIVLENHKGQIYDLSSLQTDFSITESIYHAGLILSINIKDSINFFEIGQLTGQETITVNLTQGSGPDNGIPKTISKMFFVTEYPLYGKTENRIQVYTIKGVSQHIYLSKLKRISRAFSGNMADFIKDILITDLKVKQSDIVQSKQSSPLVAFIVPNLNPMDAIQWVLRRCYDSHGSPWYCYETLDGKIHIESHMDINAKAKEKNIKEYSDGQFFQNRVGSEEDFTQRSRRVLNLASNIGISKYLASVNGAYASKSVYVNISSKKIETVNFNYASKFPYMAKIGSKSTLSNSFTPETRGAINATTLTQSSDLNAGALTLSQFSDSNVNYIPLNEKSMGKDNYHSTTKNGSINIANSVNENMQFISHDFTITGDLNFHSGNIISLLIRSSFKPQNQLNAQSNADEQKLFSGYYLVASVVHKFNQQYYCDVRVNTDAYSSEIFKPFKSIIDLPTSISSKISGLV